MTINDARYYESESANANDSKGDPAKNPRIATHTSDGKKGQVTDTRHGDSQQKNYGVTGPYQSSQRQWILGLTIGLRLVERLRIR